ncbi:MAG: SMC-Scp complex subunit ScpB [Beijerinckiaceae bacterium]
MSKPTQLSASFRFQPAGSEEEMSAAMALGTAVRIAEALLFAAREPLSEDVLTAAIPASVSLRDVMAHLEPHYLARGVNLVRIGGKWAFRTAPDLGYLMTKEVEEPKKLSRAAVETLAIVAYHQPVTRAEIEDIRGVATAKGTLDVLMETGWVRMRGRRKTPGRPITFGTTEAFLSHFGLNVVGDLPGLDELRQAGMFDGRVPGNLLMPLPSDDPTLRSDEDPLEADPLVLALEERINAAEEPLLPADESEDSDSADSEDARLNPLDGERL